MALITLLNPIRVRYHIHPIRSNRAVACTVPRSFGADALSSLPF
jgi:hypothetical protein